MKKKARYKILNFGGQKKYFALIILYLLFVKCSSFQKFHKNFRDPVIIKDGYSKGKLLIAPIVGNGDIGILNKNGLVERILSTKKIVHSVKLNKSNCVALKKSTWFLRRCVPELVVSHKTSNDKIMLLRKKGILGMTGLISVYDINSLKLKKSFEDPSLHHDMDSMDSRFIFALSWKIKQIKYRNENINILDDSIVKIDLEHKKIVNRYHFSDYLPIDDALESIYNSQEYRKNKEKVYDIWHSNSIDYIESNPINGNPAILVTLALYKHGTVIIIDLHSNKTLWKSSDRYLFATPHDARWTNTGTITFFDNGTFPSKNNNFPSMSRAVEYDIKKEKIIWQFGRGKNFMDSYKFFSPFISGVQKTTKGYLITVGITGLIVEVSPEKKMLWALPAAASFLKQEWSEDSPPILGTEIFKASQYQSID